MNGVKWNVVSTVVCMLIQIIKLSVLTYLIDKSAFGIVAIAMMVISFTDIFSEIGLTVAVIHKQEISDNQYSSIYWMNIFMSIIIWIVVWLISPFVASFYQEPILKTIIPILGIQILFNGFGKMFHTIKTKRMEFDFIAKVKMLSSFIGFLTTIILAYFSLGVYSLVYGQVVQVLINQGVYTITGLGKEKILFHFNFSEIRDFVKIGLYNLGSQFFDFMAAKIDILLIGRFFGMEDLGVYNIAKDLMLKPYAIISALVSNVASSAFAKIQSNMDALRSNYKKVVRLISLICIIIYATMFTFADTIVSILYAPEFSEVAIFLRIFVVIGVINSINGEAGILQIALGRTDIGFRWTIIRVISYLIVIFASSYYTTYVVAYSQMILTIAFFFVFWKLVIYPLCAIPIKDYIDIFKESFYVSFVLSFLFLTILKFTSLNIVLQLFMMALFLTLHFIYYWKFQRSYVHDILKLVIKK